MGPLKPPWDGIAGTEDQRPKKKIEDKKMMTDGFSTFISENAKDIQGLGGEKMTYVTSRAHPD